MHEQIYKIALEAGGSHYPEVGGRTLEKFTELVVAECCARLSRETIRHDGYGYNQHALYQILKEHFGIQQ